MLGLYLYTLIIGHNSCNIISILNELPLQKKLHNFVTNNVFLDKEVETQQQQNEKKSNIKPLPEPWIKTGSSHTQSGCVASAPSHQLRLSIVVKLFNCFDAIGWNAYKQSRICGPHIFNKVFFFLKYFYMHGLLYLAVSHNYLRE